MTTAMSVTQRNHEATSSIGLSQFGVVHGTVHKVSTSWSSSGVCIVCGMHTSFL